MANIKTIRIPVSQEDFLMTYLTSINGILNLTSKEQRVLHKMLEISTEITGTKDIRQQLKDALAFKSVMDVTNMIKALKDKKVIIKNSELKGYQYNPVVIPTSLKIEIDFKIV